MSISYGQLILNIGLIIYIYGSIHKS